MESGDGGQTVKLMGRRDSGWNQEVKKAILDGIRRRRTDGILIGINERLCMKRRWRTDEAKNGNEKLKMADTEAKNGRRREVSELDRKK
jgi:hypothetical protein